MDILKFMLNDHHNAPKKIHNYILFIVPLLDEELFNRGVKGFIKSGSFARLNVGFALDEGPGGSKDKIFISYVQKTRWRRGQILLFDRFH